MASRASLPWLAYAGAAVALALVVVGGWVWAVALRGPVLYGEGAVAHAAILARDGLEYTTGARFGDIAPIFTAANYPPLYFHLAGLGPDPFVSGRVLSVAATLVVASAIAWRARAGGPLVAGAIALAWLASVPVAQWGPAVKPDPLALALTVGAVLALAAGRPRPLVAGALIGLAALAKPTALLPGLALFAYVARRDPAGAARGALGAVAAAVAAAAVTFGPGDVLLFPERMRVHVIDWNALPWRIELLIGLVVVALLVLAVPAVTAAMTRPARGAIAAYVVGAGGIVLLGGREGATINYLLDLSAALALAVAEAAPRLATTRAYPSAALGQAVLALVLLNPFPGFPSLLQPTGKWGAPERIAYVRDYVPGTILIEDSGLLVANGREPIVDDLFLWSRVHARGGSFTEGPRLIAAVRAGEFDAIVSEADLERIGQEPGYARQRWHPDLVAAVLERYHMPRRVFGLCPQFVWCQQLFVYVRR